MAGGFFCSRQVEEFGLDRDYGVAASHITVP